MAATPSFAVPHGPPVLLVDLDGTVRKGKTELGRFVNGPADVEVFPEAVERMQEWTDRGGWVVGVTNQAGIALGYMFSEDNAMAGAETIRQSDRLIREIFTCEHLPDAGCWCRKPEPGLIYRALAYVATMASASRRADCLMVGDMDTDRQAAERAGIPFQWAADWRAATATP